MTTEPDKIVEHDVTSGGIANHHLVYCVTSYKSHTPTQTHRTIEMRNYNIDNFCNDLDLCDWVSIEFEDVDETYWRFKDLSTQVCTKHCLFVSR